MEYVFALVLGYLFGCINPATVIAKIAELQPYLSEYNEYIKALNDAMKDDVVGAVVGKSE